VCSGNERKGTVPTRSQTAQGSGCVRITKDAPSPAAKDSSQSGQKGKSTMRSHWQPVASHCEHGALGAMPSAEMSRRPSMPVAPCATSCPHRQVDAGAVGEMPRRKNFRRLWHAAIIVFWRWTLRMLADLAEDAGESLTGAERPGSPACLDHLGFKASAF